LFHLLSEPATRAPPSSCDGRRSLLLTALVSCGLACTSPSGAWAETGTEVNEADIRAAVKKAFDKTAGMSKVQLSSQTSSA
jgi:hypothetical protein